MLGFPGLPVRGSGPTAQELEVAAWPPRQAGPSAENGVTQMEGGHVGRNAEERWKLRPISFKLLVPQGKWSVRFSCTTEQIAEGKYHVQLKVVFNLLRSAGRWGSISALVTRRRR